MDHSTNCANENLHCATDGGTAFSSTKCPPPNANPMSGRLEQTCELPFGFIYTPMTKIPQLQQLSTTTSSPNLPAGVMCTKCMSYLNLYCETSEIFFDAEKENSMMRWRCALCKTENIISVKNSGNDLEEQGTAGLFDTMISQHVVELCQPLTPPLVNPFGTTTTTTSHSSKTVILVVDDNLPATEVHAIGNVLRNVLDQKTGGNSFSWQIGLIVFGKSISIYKLGVYSGIVVADVVRSHEGFVVLTGDDSRSDVFSRSYLGTSIEALVSCLTAQFNADEQSRKGNVFASSADDVESRTNGNSTKKTRLQILKERKQSRLQRQDIDCASSRRTSTNGCDDLLNSPWTQASERITKSKPPYRCTGDAVLCAVDLASFGEPSLTTIRGPASGYHDSRILLFTNGCPNFGEGSVVDTKGDTTGGLAAYSTVDSIQMTRACSYYDLIGKSAVDTGVGIDVFCAGSSELGFPAYLSLVEASAGYVISHDTFASSRLQFNLRYILLETHMSRSNFPAKNVDKSDAIDLHESSQTFDENACINGCTVDLRMSR